MEQNVTSLNKNELQFGFFLVAFIHVLDQRAALKELDVIPTGLYQLRCNHG